MAIKILVKRGLEADLLNAGVAAGELKFTTDTKKLFTVYFGRQRRPFCKRETIMGN